mmetsp:Transcript_18599/g.46596  ORF Transcript_18599/g.46596 Transcript_18599/m.46596 type:complete len:86 (+) Transcript_18599:1689-1946(+)
MALQALHLVNTSGLIAFQVDVSFARSPLGAVYVIFTEFCKTGTGNAGDGNEVSHNRKVGFKALSVLNSSQIRSKLGIQDVAKWQF